MLVDPNRRLESYQVDSSCKKDMGFALHVITKRLVPSPATELSILTLFASITLAMDDRLGTVALPGVEEGRDKLWAKAQEAFQYV